MMMIRYNIAISSNRIFPSSSEMYIFFSCTYFMFDRHMKPESLLVCVNVCGNVYIQVGHSVN
jgi:uncharacterized membrane protein